MAVQRYISDKILGPDTAPPAEVVDSAEGQKDDGGSWTAWLFGDQRQVDAAEANRLFHEGTKLLQGSETCEIAFKASRDMTLFTTKRLVLVSGKAGKAKISSTSIPWSCVQAFAVCSGEKWIDKDSEMMIWTDIFHDDRTEQEEYQEGEETKERTVWIREPGLSYIQVDFQKDKVDLPAIGRYWPQGAPGWGR